MAGHLRHSLHHRKTARHTKTILNMFLPTSILISSTHSPITSLSIAITDAIGASKHHQPAANQLRGNDLRLTAEEGVGQGWEILGDGLGGYGSGCWSHFILVTTTQLL